jgi:hypothetical protein
MCQSPDDNVISSSEEFVRLRSSDAPADYNRAAHEEASEETWLDVIARFPDYRRWVAHNKTCPEQILRLLSTDESVDVRWTVAYRRSAPGDVLLELAHDEDESVRARVAQNPKTPNAALESLASDPSRIVREAIERRANTSSA